MYYAVIVKICDSGEGCSNQIGSVRLVVVAFSTDAIEQLSSKCEIGYEVNCKQYQLCSQSRIPASHTVVHGLKVVDQSEDIPMAHGYPLQYGDFIPDLADISLATRSAMRSSQTMCSRPAMSLLLMTFAA